MVCPFSTLGCNSQHCEKVDFHLILLLRKVLDIEQNLIEVDVSRHRRTTAQNNVDDTPAPQRHVAASVSSTASVLVYPSVGPTLHDASHSPPRESRSSPREHFFQELLHGSTKTDEYALPAVENDHRTSSSDATARARPLFLKHQRQLERDLSAHMSLSSAWTTRSPQQGGSSSSTNTGQHEVTSLVVHGTPPTPPSSVMLWPPGKAQKHHEQAMPHTTTAVSSVSTGEISASQQRVNRLVRRQNKKAAYAGVASLSRRALDTLKKRPLDASAGACAQCGDNSSNDEDNDEERAAQGDHGAAHVDPHHGAPQCAAERIPHSDQQQEPPGRAAKVAKVTSAPYLVTSAPNIPSGSDVRAAPNISTAHHALLSWSDVHAGPPSTHPRDGHVRGEKPSSHGGWVSSHSVLASGADTLTPCNSGHDRVTDNPGVLANAPALSIPSVLNAQSHSASHQGVALSVLRDTSKGKVTPSSPLAMDHDLVTRREDDPYATNGEDSASSARHTAAAITPSSQSREMRRPRSSSSAHRIYFPNMDLTIHSMAQNSCASLENSGRDGTELSGTGSAHEPCSTVDGAKDGGAAAPHASDSVDALSEFRDDALARQLVLKYTQHRRFEPSGTQPMDIDSMMQSPSGNQRPNFIQPLESISDDEPHTPKGKKRPRPGVDSALIVSKKLLRKKITYSEALDRFLLFDKLPDSDALNAALCAMQVLPPEDETAIKLLDGIKSEAARLKARLYRGKIFRNIAKHAADAAPHLVNALTQYDAVIENEATKASDRQKAITARDSIIYQLKKERLDFTDQVREQARKLPKPEKVVGSENKWRTQGETVDLDLNLCSCRIKIGCKHMCLVYGAEGGTSLKDRTKDQLRALLKLNNMSTSGRSNEEMIKLLMDAKALGGAAPPCPKCGSYMDDENGLFRCRKNREGRARKCDFFASEPRVPLRGL